MAEPETDRSVDECIADVQAALDRLKAAQRRDDGSDEEPEQPPAKTLRDANVRVREHFRRARYANEQK